VCSILKLNSFKKGKIMTKAKVLLVGMHPDTVDYPAHPGLTREKLISGLNNEIDSLNNLGYAARMHFIDGSPDSVTELKTRLSDGDYDCVMIGAGVRTVDKHFLLFEELINLVHQNAVNSKICFNTGPTDSAAAVKRWVTLYNEKSLIL